MNDNERIRVQISGNGSVNLTGVVSSGYGEKPDVVNGARTDLSKGAGITQVSPATDHVVHRVDDRFVISADGSWLPGSFESEEAARQAFRLPGDILQRLQNEANTKMGGSSGVLTLVDVLNAKSPTGASLADQIQAKHGADADYDALLKKGIEAALRKKLGEGFDEQGAPK